MKKTLSTTLLIIASFLSVACVPQKAPTPKPAPATGNVYDASEYTLGGNATDLSGQWVLVSENYLEESVDTSTSENLYTVNGKVRSTCNVTATATDQYSIDCAMFGLESAVDFTGVSTATGSSGTHTFSYSTQQKMTGSSYRRVEFQTETTATTTTMDFTMVKIADEGTFLGAISGGSTNANVEVAGSGDQVIGFLEFAGTHTSVGVSNLVSSIRVVAVDAYPVAANKNTIEFYSDTGASYGADTGGQDVTVRNIDDTFILKDDDQTPDYSGLDDSVSITSSSTVSKAKGTITGADETEGAFSLSYTVNF